MNLFTAVLSVLLVSCIQVGVSHAEEDQPAVGACIESAERSCKSDVPISDPDSEPEQAETPVASLPELGVESGISVTASVDLPDDI